MTKAELRKKYLEKRESLSQDEVLSLSEAIFQNFIHQFKRSENQKIHCFLSIPEKGEVNTQIFENFFFENGIRVFVPKIFRNKLISVEITSETPVIKNSWGIPEPESNEDSGEKNFDFVITPLLYCDRHGNRVGYGKGYYDGFFEDINPNSVKIGVNFFNPDEEIDDVWKNDIPLDYLVTPTTVLSFGGTASKSTK
ncbi:MAG: 5-formyltetrahydrofolate cyclo-ligase [Weeksellaceae bacterium]|nr:5-formyltetrahydrofolate cyclo-ligase [Bacteroidota bacterium]MCG2781763.1 5-formyltetrahydrofolate cyclo-ligase [Weeksellaceae bacterium]